MKFGKVQILYDTHGDITSKLGEDVLTVLILPNAQIFESYFEYFTLSESDEDNVCRIYKEKLKPIRLLVAIKLK